MIKMYLVNLVETVHFAKMPLSVGKCGWLINIFDLQVPAGLT